MPRKGVSVFPTDQALWSRQIVSHTLMLAATTNPGRFFVTFLNKKYILYYITLLSLSLFLPLFPTFSHTISFFLFYLSISYLCRSFFYFHLVSIYPFLDLFVALFFSLSLSCTISRFIYLSLYLFFLDFFSLSLLTFLHYISLHVSLFSWIFSLSPHFIALYLYLSMCLNLILSPYLPLSLSLSLSLSMFCTFEDKTDCFAESMNSATRRDMRHGNYLLRCSHFEVKFA